jgi:hypothetical protein
MDGLEADAFSYAAYSHRKYSTQTKNLKTRATGGHDAGNRREAGGKQKTLEIRDSGGGHTGEQHYKRHYK